MSAHPEEGAGDPVLVVLGDVDDLVVPGDDAGEGEDEAEEDVEGGVDPAVGEGGEAGGRWRRVGGGQGADLEQRRQGDGQDDGPGEQQEQKNAAACQDGRVSGHSCHYSIVVTFGHGWTKYTLVFRWGSHTDRDRDNILRVPGPIFGRQH